MGINLGAFIAPLTVAWLRTHYGWGPAFMSAAVAMLISLAIFTGFNKYVAAAAVKVEPASTVEAPMSSEEVRSRVITLLAVFIISTVFWLAFYQIFYTFTFWARDNTLTSLNPETFQVFEPLGVILLSPALVALWVWLQRRNAEPSTPVKMLLGRAAGGDRVWHAGVRRRQRRRHRPCVGAVADLGQRHHRARRNLAEPDGAVARQPASLRRAVEG